MSVKEQVLEVLEQNKGEYISGGKLAAELKVSRNAVWKAIKSLQKEGYSIEAGTNRGYRLQVENDILSAPGIRRYLLPEYRQLELEVYKSIDSTNTRIKEYASDGRPEGLIVIAEEQTNGRGRMGRSFYSPSSSGIYMSFLLRPRFSAEESLYLTTAAAAAAAETIDEVLGIKPDEKGALIKWVNDVFFRGKKVCGILTEASVNVENSMLEYAVTGIGFNVYEPEGGFPKEIQEIAGSILGPRPGQGQTRDLSAEGLDAKRVEADVRSRIAAGMINHFMKYYETLTERSYMPEYKRRSFLIGQEVRTMTEPSIQGIAVDIDEEGHLILELADGSRKILSSGEVSVRPIKP